MRLGGPTHHLPADWAFGLGFALVLGSLAVKTYRVDRIFRNKSPSFKFPDIKVVLYITGVTLGEIICLLVRFQANQKRETLHGVDSAGFQIFQFWLESDSGEKIITIPNSNVILSQPDCRVSHVGAVAILYMVGNTER